MSQIIPYKDAFITHLKSKHLSDFEQNCTGSKSTFSFEDKGNTFSAISDSIKETKPLKPEVLKN